ncbi:hypothetical protein F4778DRAFT_411753 [Xylariomycetidae sp. FL2044]|nr:hypothetical protein F4778DRAFT_411753 [Xylariomycetidae sp. FL2044]
MLQGLQWMIKDRKVWFLVSNYFVMTRCASFTNHGFLPAIMAALGIDRRICDPSLTSVGLVLVLLTW